MKRREKVVSMILALIMLVSSTLFTFTSCDWSGTGGETPGGTNPPGGDGDTTVNYTVTVKTQGGMAFADMPVYIWDYANGEMGDELIEYGSTDANGKITFKLDPNGSYAAQINGDVPKGYEVNDFYPLVGTNTNITLKSSLVQESIAGKQLELGDIMYDFELPSVDGTPFKLSEALATHEMVLINFWYTGCSWCITEFPYMETVTNEYKDKVAVVAVDNNPDETMSDIRNFLTDFEMNGTPLSFEFSRDESNSVGGAFNVNAWPTSVIIDRYGMIAMVHSGALTSERQFRIIYDYFTGDDYKQSIVKNPADITPVVKPNVSQPSSDEIGAVLDGGAIDVTYTPDENEYSWPFVITEKDGEACIKATNSAQPSSFSIINAQLTLNAGDVVAFDYFASSELSCDIMYVIVNGHDIYSISGLSEDWKTCFAYVAEEAGEYTVSLSYLKDGDGDVGDDTVYVKNLRVVSEADINAPSYIFRYCATNPDDYGTYQDYVDIYYNETDGYYHVDSVDGPLLIANLMGYTLYNSEDSVFNAAQGKLTATDYDRLITYCGYASNGKINGSCTVNAELAELLKSFVGSPDPDDKEWLQLCNYYDSYGTDEELEDPIKGLAIFSAYPTVEGGAEIGENTPVEEAFPNSIVYDRLIMPRGLLYAFTPTESGVYKVSSYSDHETNAWIFKADNISDRTTWLTYSNVYRPTEVAPRDNNCYMIAYLEAGTTYYIDIAYYDVYQNGTIYFKVERIGDAGYYRFSSASPAYFTYRENTEGAVNKIEAGGIKVTYNEISGKWHEDRRDADGNIIGSYLYADFTQETGVFSDTIMELVSKGAFNLSTTENDEYIKAMLKSNNAYNYYLKLYLKALWGTEYEAKYDEEYKVDEVLVGTYHGEKDENGKPTKSDKDVYILELRDSMANNSTYNTDANFKVFLKEYWGEDSYAEYMEIYKVDEVLAGVYHGNGEDYTDDIEAYYGKIIKAGDIIDGETVGENDARIGCVIVDAGLANLLQILMDKYTFADVENSWIKLCYYSQYFGEASPI